MQPTVIRSQSSGEMLELDDHRITGHYSITVDNMIKGCRGIVVSPRVPAPGGSNIEVL